MQIESICLGQLATNCYLVETKNKTIIIDPAEPSPELSSLIGDRSVDFVVNTHGHFDHVGGNWQLQDDGAEVLLHKADLPFVDQAFPNHNSVDRYVGEGDTIADFFRVVHVPGHSPGSIILVAEGLMFVGDLLFAGSIGRCDLPGGSTAKMTESLRRICEFSGSYDIYPGHGPETTLDKEKQQNPFLLQLGVK